MTYVIKHDWLHSLVGIYCLISIVLITVGFIFDMATVQTYGYIVYSFGFYGFVYSIINSLYEIFVLDNSNNERT